MYSEDTINNGSSPLLTLKEASGLLGCHPNTLRKWDRNGVLRAVRVGTRKDRRYRKEDILRLAGAGYVKNREEVARVSSVRKTYFDEYATILSRWGNLDANSTFVDVPCGTGEMTKTLAEDGFGSRYYLIDISPEMIEAAQRNVPERGIFRIGDASEISEFVPEKVDAVFCLNGFHIYVNDKQKFLEGVHGVLKPGGVFIFDVSTRGIGDAASREYLSAEDTEFGRLAKASGTEDRRPVWPDERLLEHYRGMAIEHGFSVTKTVSIDTWMSVDKMVNETLQIPGRLRPWLPHISDAERIAIYKQANEKAREKTGARTIKHNRVFFIAEKG